VNRTSRPQQIINRALYFMMFVGLLFFCTAISEWNYGPDPQESRRVKISVPPEYPELARRLNLRGTARVQIRISPNGTVTDAKEVGGNPVLLDALVRAVKKWKYEPADKESTVEVKFDFAPGH